MPPPPVDTDVLDVHAKAIQTHGITIAGFGGCPRYNGKSYGQYTEEEAGVFLSQLGHVDLLITHSQPAGLTLSESKPISSVDDFLWRSERSHPDKAHKGFQALTDYIHLSKPGYVLHGHVHKNAVQQFGKSLVYSVYGTRVINL